MCVIILDSSTSRYVTSEVFYDDGGEGRLTFSKNHGIPQASVAKIHDTAHKFFALDVDKKMEAYMGQSKVGLPDDDHLNSVQERT